MLPKKNTWRIVENPVNGYDLFDANDNLRATDSNPKKLASRAFNYFNADAVEHDYDLRKAEDL
jgi:hypothetical protein